jgi:hypothetical protein
MYVRYKVLPGNKIEVRAFFSGGSPAVEAQVRVSRPDGKLIGPPGLTNDSGVYEFTYDKAEDLKVAVTDGEHAKEIVVAAGELTDAPERVFKQDPVAQDEPSRLAEILAGVSLIVALAAFWLSLRNATRLRALHRAPATPQATPPAAGTPRPAPLPTAPDPR